MGVNCWELTWLVYWSHSWSSQDLQNVKMRGGNCPRPPCKVENQLWWLDPCSLAKSKTKLTSREIVMSPSLMQFKTWQKKYNSFCDLTRQIFMSNPRQNRTPFSKRERNVSELSAEENMALLCWRAELSWPFGTWFHTLCNRMKCSTVTCYFGGFWTQHLSGLWTNPGQHRVGLTRASCEGTIVQGHMTVSQAVIIVIPFLFFKPLCFQNHLADKVLAAFE